VTVYIGTVRQVDPDALPERVRRAGGNSGNKWCHLFPDPATRDLEELHAVARVGGLARGWFQGDRYIPHYDVTASMRSRLVRAGAVPIEDRDYVARWNQMRKIERAKEDTLEASGEARVVHVLDGIEGSVYVGRAFRGRQQSPFHNPFKVNNAHPRTGRFLDRAAAIAAFRDHLLGSPELLAQLPALRGQTLACWCRHDGERPSERNACHADVLMAVLAACDDDALIAGNRARIEDALGAAVG
jgi:hypothetical protein